MDTDDFLVELKKAEQIQDISLRRIFLSKLIVNLAPFEVKDKIQKAWKIELSEAEERLKKFKEEKNEVMIDGQISVMNRIKNVPLWLKNSTVGKVFFQNWNNRW